MQVSYWTKVRLWMEENQDRYAADQCLDASRMVDDAARYFKETNRDQLLAMAYGIAARFGLAIQEE